MKAASWVASLFTYFKKQAHMRRQIETLVADQAALVKQVTQLSARSVAAESVLQRMRYSLYDPALRGSHATWPYVTCPLCGNHKSSFVESHNEFFVS